MPITEQQLLPILPNAGRQAGVSVPVLNVAMSRYAIVSTLRIAAFIAQVGHESGQLRFVREIWGLRRSRPDMKAGLTWATPLRGMVQSTVAGG